MVYTHVQKKDDEQTQRLRKEGGRLLKFLREKAGYSQKQFVTNFGGWHYTFVSQIENGRNRVPPDQMKKYAELCGLDVRSFALMMMRYYDPVTFIHIFENDSGVLNGTDFAEFMDFKAKDAE